MDARIYQMADLRSQHQSRIATAEFYRRFMVSDGLALMTSAMSFWATYAARMTSYHASILSACYSQSSNLLKTTGKPSGWR